MTDKDILEIAKCCGMDSFTGRNDDDKESTYWECREEQLLKFVKEIYEKGYSDGKFENAEPCYLG